MLNQQTKKLRYDQKGFASIVIALILIVVLSLVTVGFAQLARREQQDALDKQLASQAYYAAESGVNDIQQLVDNAYNNAAATPSLADLTPSPIGTEDPTKCLNNQNPSPSIPGLPNSTISQTGASYTCVLLDLAPPNLLWSGVSPDSQRYVTFSTTGVLDHLTVYWDSTDNAANFKSSIPANAEFTPDGSWGGAPAVIEVSLTPLYQTDRASMITNTFNVYLYPSTGDGSVQYDTTNQGQVIGGHCSAANPNYPCSVEITGIPNNTGANEKYLIRLTDYYDSSDISVGSAYTSSGTQLDFTNGQAQIDVTGKARNVLKRIQVRAPLTETSPLPPYAIEGQNVCKRFSTYPSTTTPDTLPGCDLN